MKPILAAGAVMALTACIEQTGSSSSTAVEPGRQLLVFYNSGYDEPPTGGILVACGAPSGICVELGPGNQVPLTRTAAGWSYMQGANQTVLSMDGSGMIFVPGGVDQSVDWMTEPWG